MAFVKLDCGILDSSLWLDREARELFITALLMADPHEVMEPLEQFKVLSVEKTGFVVPVGWYGMVRAAGVGIISRAGLDPDSGLKALERLGEPDDQSRTTDFEGRRMVRVSGGFIILNFAKYREKDHTAAERSRRYREKRMMESTPEFRAGKTQEYGKRRKYSKREAMTAGQKAGAVQALKDGLNEVR